MEPCVECNPSSSEFREIIKTATDWALLNGLCKISNTSCSEIIVEHYPFPLLPSTIPKKLYSEAYEMQNILNELTHKVADDYEFLKESLKETIKADDFIKKLFHVYETVRKEGFAQEISLGITRSDFLMDDQKSWKLVEINTSCAGFAFGDIITRLHKMVLQEMGSGELSKNIPDNNNLEKVALGMFEAWKMFNDERAAILFVIRNETYAMYELRALEFEVKNLYPKMKVLRRTPQELAATAKLGPNKELIVDNTLIALVYNKTAFVQKLYTSEEIWNLRLLLERSKAIKCPSIQYQLAGTKKVQQILSVPGVLEKFINNSELVSKVRNLFTGIYSLDFNDEADRAAELAIANPDNFVLKPQREAGGNNVFGPDILTTLEKLKENKERPAWILMEKIFSPAQKNYFIHAKSHSDYEAINSVSEVGIFGVIIGDSRTIFSNEEVGYLARAKPSHVNEVGIGSGGGAYTSIYLMQGQL